MAVLASWPSWAPRAEYLCIDQISYLGPLFHLAIKPIWKMLNGAVHCPILKNAPISKNKKWPVIVFSHGLGCSRFAYSRICSDLASHGFFVAATEHREGSACASFTMEDGQKNWIPHRRIPVSENEYSDRNQQLHFRVDEMKRTMNLMEKLNEGDGVVNVLEDACDLTMFKNCLDLSSPVLAGQSFGGEYNIIIQ